MENKKKIGIGIVLLCLILLCGIFSYFKITYSYFGENLTGQMGTLRDVNYYSNYPSDINIEDKKISIVSKVNSEYTVKNNMFDVPSNYNFSHWNTEKNDNGTKYNANETFKLTDNIDLYAIWVIIPNYGDINLDGVVNIDDSVLLDKYLKENGSLTSAVLSNSDVNLDGKIDSVDVDIIKQACLGTRGYESLLSNKPVLIYDIYEGTIDNNNNNGGSGSTNNGNSGNGGGSSGAGKPSNNNTGSSSNNNDSSTGGNSNTEENSSSNNKEEVNIPEQEEVIDNSNKKEEDKNKINNKSYVWIFVIVILFITLRFVILIIRKIIKIKKEDNNCDK